MLGLTLITLTGCGGGTVMIDGKRAPRCVDKTPEPGDVLRAVVNDHFDCLKDLARAGANINENMGTDTEQMTPLMAAVALQREPIAQYLLERGAALHPMFSGYRARDFVFHIYGDKSTLFRSFARSERVYRRD